VSYDLDKITSYLEKTFIELGYTPIVDKAQNILVRKPASKGCEKLPTVMLQGHSDMVGAKDPSSTHDFKKDPIKIKVVNG
jgi:dipeptidase D